MGTSKALETSLLEKISELIPYTVYIFDLNLMRPTWLNRRSLEVFGYDLAAAEKLGDSYFSTVVHPEDIKIIEDAVKKFEDLKEGEPLSIEYRIKTSQGIYLWVSDRVTVFSRDKNGKAESTLGVLTEIAERKAYEENLKKTIEKFNLSLAAASMGTWEWDIEKNFLTWDQRMYDLHDMTMSLGISPLDEMQTRMLKEDFPAVYERTLQAAKDHQDFYTSYRVTYQNGEIHHIRCYGKFLSNVNEKRMYGVAWDSTEEVLTEKEAVEAKAKLISTTKMAALGEMSGGIAHEINNPLTVIQARAFQLGQMVETGKIDTEKVKQIGESISRTADKIAKIVKSLRSFAREGTYDPFELIPMRQIIDETLDFCRTRFYNHGVEIEVGPISEDLELECRLIQIEQVLLNLLNNSFDAVQNREEKWIRVEVQESQDYVDLKVMDSGAEISQSVADQMMLPFFTTKEVGKGTGLGLSISSGIIKGHEGELFLDRTQKNTTFVIRLPRWHRDID